MERHTEVAARCQPQLACDSSESAAPVRELKLQLVKHFLPFVEIPTACGAV